MSDADAKRLLALHGPNNPTPTQSRHRFAILTKFVANPLVVILLIAAAISFCVGDRVNSLIIIGIILFSVTLDSIQNIRSEAAVKRLQSEIAPTATVLRDGEWQTIPREEVVPGDLIKLDAGDLVPADGRLIEERDLHVQEAALTGESLPVEKEVGTGDDTEKVFLGTAVVSGTAILQVEKTGLETRFGEIARELKSRAPPTEFERGIREFGLLILRVVLALTIFVFVVLVVLKRDVLQSLMFAVALSVGLTPGFLPMITTLTLSRGAVRMARQKVIVKNLASIQNFGSMDILCSDKTGTLTSGNMSLEKSFDVTGNESDFEVLELAKVSAAFHSGTANPLDTAILQKTGSDTSAYRKLDEIPFDFERRRVSVVVESGGKRLLISKGAPEGLLVNCADVRDQSRQLISRLEADGLRVLAVAVREVGVQDHYGPEDEANLHLVGFLAFADPPLPDALAMLDRLRQDGLNVKIISGDSEAVCRHICRQIGLDPGHVESGDEIEKLSEVRLSELAERITVFARVNPAQKNRIILALKKRGHVVGYIGDGINDAPSLHSADVGISFSGATDVAKDAAQIILVERNLALMHNGVLEGRTAYGNVMKYLLMGTSSNFGNMFSMAAASLFLPFLPMLATQILLNNTLYDLAQVTIPTDAVDASFIQKPKRWDIRLIRDFMVYVGPISSVFDFLTFYVLLQVFHADEKLFHTGWFVESLSTQTLVIFVIRTHKLPWRSMPSWPLTTTTLLIVLLGFLIPVLPVAAALGFVQPPPMYLAFVIAAIVMYLVLVELMKRRLFRQIEGPVAMKRF